MQFLYYPFIILILLLLALVYLKLATTYNIIDKPNERSSHTIPTIRGGGIIFFLAVILFFLSNNFQYPYFIAGVSLLAIISFVDDIVSLSARFRLLFQCIGVALLLFETGFLAPPYTLAIVLFIATIGYTNIYNFMDGINGITGFNSLAILLGFWVLNSMFTVVPDDIIRIPFLSVLVFGFFNFRKKARFFAGDVGSITMAMIITFLFLMFMKQLQAPILILLLIVYLLDGGITILRRLFNRENVFEPHRSHLYQRLVQVTSLSHLQVSAIYGLVQLVMIIPVLLTIEKDWQTQSLVLLAYVLTMSIIYLIVYKKVQVKVHPKN